MRYGAKKKASRTSDLIAVPPIKTRRFLAGIQNDPLRALHCTSGLQQCKNSTPEAGASSLRLHGHITHLGFGRLVKVEPADGNRGFAIPDRDLDALGFKFIAFAAPGLAPRLAQDPPPEIEISFPFRRCLWTSVFQRGRIGRHNVVLYSRITLLPMFFKTGVCAGRSKGQGFPNSP